MIDLRADKKIVVTGAGGWLGTEFLEALATHYGAETLQRSIVCLGSRRRVLFLSGGAKLEVHPLGDYVPEGNIEGFVHLAFQTRDKVAALGTSAYCFENLLITSRTVGLIEETQPRWIATVSSGAVHTHPGGPLENDVVANPYGFAKRIEETLLKSVANAQGANLAIGRLWGAMGQFMPPNPAYAISDFIVSGLNGRDITVTSTNRVFRRYVDAGEFMNVLTSSAEAWPSTTFDSGGHLVELGDLAKLVADLAGVDVVDREFSHGQADNVYYPTSSDFERLAQRLKISLTGLEGLVNRTIAGHRKQFL